MSYFVGDVGSLNIVAVDSNWFRVFDSSERPFKEVRHRPSLKRGLILLVWLSQLVMDFLIRRMFSQLVGETRLS